MFSTCSACSAAKIGEQEVQRTNGPGILSPTKSDYTGAQHHAAGMDLHFRTSLCMLYVQDNGACLLISRMGDAFQPAQLVLAHGPQTHTRQDVPGQQGLVGGGAQGHVQSLQLLSNVDSGVNAAELLLTVCL